MSVREALHPDNLLCYEMNGEPLPQEHGFPVRLIAPGWYGVANVKWLTRIEVVDRRYAGRFMARDYVSIREQQRDGQTNWTFNTVGHDRLKSAPAKVTRRYDRYPSWAPPGARRSRRWRSKSTTGDGWRRGSMPRANSRDSGTSRDHSWRFWTFDWGTPGLGRARRSGRAHSTSTATSSQHKTTRSSPARGPTGRATGTSRAVSSFGDGRIPGSPGSEHFRHNPSS